MLQSMFYLSQLADLQSRVAVVKLEDKTRFVALSFCILEEGEI